MFRTMSNRVSLVGVLLVAVASSMCLAVLTVRVNINPHKIVLNAEGKADDVQANIPIYLTSGWEQGFTAELYFNDTIVAEAESARYCYIDDMLIIGFDRTELQNNPYVKAIANSTVTATVTATLTNPDGELITIEGSDIVEIVKPGKK